MPLKQYEISGDFEYTPPETEYDVCDIPAQCLTDEVIGKIINAAYECGYEYINNIATSYYDNIAHLIFRKIKEGR
ncbi:MAG: hypothetical protein J6V90_08725 [Treponema sp.]|nr:hypothetical protein [Treponema sp.]